MAQDDVGDVDDVQDDEEGDEAAAMRVECKPLQDRAPSSRSRSSTVRDRQYAGRPGVESIWDVEMPLLLLSSGG